MYPILIFSLSLAMAKYSLKCQTTSDTVVFSRGESITICLHFIDYTNQKASRLGFQLTVDEYTGLNPHLVYKYLKNETEKNVTLVNPKMKVSLAVQANSDNITTPYIPYVQDQMVFPLYSLVIKMDSGRVSDLIWDDGCYGGTDNCYEYDLGKYSEDNNFVAPCNTVLEKDAAECDPKIYVSFIGTDSNDNYMESAGKRISRFRQFSVGQMYGSAKSAVSGYKDKVQT